MNRIIQPNKFINFAFLKLYNILSALKFVNEDDVDVLILPSLKIKINFIVKQISPLLK